MIEGALYDLLFPIFLALICSWIAHRFGFFKLLTFSLVVFITLQALINFLVTVGLIPTKGLPLPFVSYGGTALIFHMISVAIQVAIDKRSIRYSNR